MSLHIEEEVQAKGLPKGPFAWRRQALLMGEVSRGSIAEITGYRERMARNVISDLLKKGCLKSRTKHSPLVLSFPIDAVERWFPRLYPATWITVCPDQVYLFFDKSFCAIRDYFEKAS
jgi:hypothetical protein